MRVMGADGVGSVDRILAGLDYVAGRCVYSHGLCFQYCMAHSIVHRAQSWRRSAQFNSMLEYEWPPFQNPETRSLLPTQR